MIFPTYQTETELKLSGVENIAGCDEVGAGPLAGPVVAAVCILEDGDYTTRSEDKWYFRVRDSKTVPEAEREILASEIKSHSKAYGIGETTVEEIDRLNILNARLLAMRRAVENMLSAFPNVKDVHIIVDGKFTIPDLLADNIKQQAIVSGDQKVLSIAAASIIAKVHRDSLMKELDTKYPEYGFSKHKGYGTAAHIKVIKELGATKVHRKSFLKNII
jgi:ribonuclease HII